MNEFYLMSRFVECACGCGRTVAADEAYWDDEHDEPYYDQDHYELEQSEINWKAHEWVDNFYEELLRGERYDD